MYKNDRTKKSAGLVYTQINVPAKTRCLLTREEFRERVINSLLGAFRQTFIHWAGRPGAHSGTAALAPWLGSSSACSGADSVGNNCSLGRQRRAGSTDFLLVVGLFYLLGH
jgi:hypothetical protein